MITVNSSYKISSKMQAYHLYFCSNYVMLIDIE